MTKPKQDVEEGDEMSSGHIRHFERGPNICLRCFLIGIRSEYERGGRCPNHEPDPEPVQCGTVTITGIHRAK